ncbi:hypothetical protein BURMUCF1_2240 [Burkholderia multivorans ATCC BAA-247]|nr:hypothetical protein BURMUCF1_2240 [Burkholderia multivorans ATCC BAA-247]
MHFVRRAGHPARRRPDRITRSKVCFLCHSSAALAKRARWNDTNPDPGIDRCGSPPRTA